MRHFLKFWGTRGSCPVSGPEFMQFGGNTSCLEIRYGDALAILDAGTGILPLGNQLKKEGIRKVHIFLSHMHWDHLIGFPFFKPLYNPDVEITISAPQGKGRTPQELLEQVFAAEFFPVKWTHLPAKIDFCPIEPQRSIQLGDLSIDCHFAHHVYATYCFKVSTPKESICYALDNEVLPPYDESLIALFQGCDFLIHEMQYTEKEHLNRKGWGHSSPSGVLPFIERVRPVRWIVSHHDPDHTDSDLKRFCEETRMKTSCPVEWTYDGAMIPLKE